MRTGNEAIVDGVHAWVSKKPYEHLVPENFRIRVFRTVADHLNVSREAEELLLTQPAVTQQVKALEDELGVPLFDEVRLRLSVIAYHLEKSSDGNSSG